MNQNYWTARALDHEVQSCAVNGNEFREGLRILMSDAGSDVALLESSGNIHKKSLSPQKLKDAKLNNQAGLFFNTIRRQMFTAHDRIIIS